jgi:hypothetical protein
MADTSSSTGVFSGLKSAAKTVFKAGKVAIFAIGTVSAINMFTEWKEKLHNQKVEDTKTNNRGSEITFDSSGSGTDYQAES